MSEEPRDPANAPVVPPRTPLAPSTAASNDSTPADSKPVNQLTPEEQMALFEKELKETDWGHQPC
jgi:hypothetical protein